MSPAELIARLLSWRLALRLPECPLETLGLRLVADVVGVDAAAAAGGVDRVAPVTGRERFLGEEVVDPELSIGFRRRVRLCEKGDWILDHLVLLLAVAEERRSEPHAGFGIIEDE